ncbi:MAG: prolipoprotein diacylglyceryl transferase [Bdellovibrionales bacterium]|nr:prolipoprotein diacylglyceryl transferase [Bdellovibrionales bacterium]
MAHPMVWDGSPELLNLGFFSVRWYGALFAFAFFLGLRVLNRITAREGIVPGGFDSMLSYVILGTVIGARLGHVLFYEPEVFFSDPIRVLKVWEGGLASHGGVLGVVASVYFWKRRHYGGPVIRLLDYLSVPSTMVGGMIRLGNFFNSEILGRPSDLPWAVVFKRVDDLPRHPAMLYESASYFLIFIFMMMLLKKGVHRKFKDGFLTGLFFLLVFLARFLIEFVKELQVPTEASLPLDFGQILSIPFIALGVALLLRSGFLRRGRPLA